MGRSSVIGSRTALKTAAGPALAARRIRKVVRKCHIATEIWILRNWGSEKVLYLCEPEAARVNEELQGKTRSSYILFRKTVTIVATVLSAT